MPKIQRLKLTEIFYTLQGEGRYTGYPAVFIRLAGCNLNCPWCDTVHSSNFQATADTICMCVEGNLPAKDSESVLLVITGGEPTLQDYWTLVRELHSWFPNNTIAMETNGRAADETALRILRNTQNLYLTVSPKLAVEDCSKFFDNPAWCGDELKVVLDPKADLTVLESLPEKLGDRFTHYYIQPCSEDYQPAIRLIRRNPRWKLSVQTHKVTGVE